MREIDFMRSIDRGPGVATGSGYAMLVRDSRKRETQALGGTQFF